MPVWLRLLPPAVLLLLSTGASWASQAERVEVEAAWLRAAPPNTRVHAAYLDLSNPGPDGVRLVGARSAAANSVEIHTMEQVGDRLRMRPLRWIAIPPGETRRLETGGRHLMIFGLESAARPGEVIDIELLFDDGSIRPVRFPVRRARQ